ncbi:MAG: chromosome segregation protein SMC [Alphaproteobacteria bacterium]
MLFTRLRVLGFKSFVEPTEFLIEPGLTGVVGPNGCGKSNLVEALRWVMGESSYKNMRASGMDDVIFSGSGGRPARNSAEVSLSADNSARNAPTGMNDSDALEITRRIEREAGSVYRVNGRDVRARDIQLLFADASTGAHSPAMVGQGRIGELIAAKPTDRRKLLEEAAGISGLHSRRHEAELRLRGAETNLSRLDDVITEIESQLDMLKRQARQAVRYRNLSGDIRRAEATALHLRWLEATGAENDAGSNLAQQSENATACAAQQAAAARIQAEAAAVLPELRDQAASAAAAVQRITLAQDALSAEDVRVQARLQALERHLSELAEDIAREQRMVAENEAVLQRLDAEERDLEGANAATAERQASAARQRQAAESELERSEARFSSLTGQQAEIVASRSQIERAIGDARRRTDKLNDDIATLRQRIVALGPADENEARVKSLQQAHDAAEQALEAAEAGAQAGDDAVAAHRQEADAARSATADAERQANRIETEIATLERVLMAEADSAYPPVLDDVQVEPGYETALAAAFGDDLDAPSDESAPAHWRSVTIGQLAPLPDGIERLAERVTAPSVLTKRLSQIGIVTRADGAALQGKLLSGQRLVSREGDLWRWDGYVATADANHAAARRLATRNRLAELEAEAAPARRAADICRSTQADVDDRARQADEAERSARETLRQARRTRDEARESLSNAEQAASRAAAQRSALEESLARLGEDQRDAEAARVAAQADLADAPDPQALAGDLEAARSAVAIDRSALAEARAVVENLRREAELRSGRLAAIAKDRQDWRERGRNAESQIVTLTGRRQDFDDEKAMLAEEPARIEEQRQALLSQTSTAEDSYRVASDRLAEGEAVLKEADAEARAKLEALASAREQRGRAEERLVAAQGRLEEVRRQITETLECAPDEVVDIAELRPDKPLPNLGDTEARLERYRRERERLGAVNLRADIEASEIAERRDALVGERDDLVAAIQRLRQGIGSLNREGRERLLAAFKDVNSHFQTLFTHLFGGGHAELQLTESDDPLEAGLEILARPPGKKPQIMTLLSGGEQALTALSLIFAVFLTNPAPICVLDEVDAPLDDANVLRFCDLLDEMTRKTDTRFVVITHNPITMARMNRLFGVTMAERGVSQMVSVDLETAESFREAG